MILCYRIYEWITRINDQECTAEDCMTQRWSHWPDFTLFNFVTWTTAIGSQTDDQQSNVIVPAAADVLDTAQVSGKVLHLLQLYKIPISQFGLHVLERSQGRTSELLNKPKPFEKLSQDGREVYRKMKRWLEQEDPIGYVRRKIVQGATLLPLSIHSLKVGSIISNRNPSPSWALKCTDLHLCLRYVVFPRVIAEGDYFFFYTKRGDYWSEGDYSIEAIVSNIAPNILLHFCNNHIK